MHAPVGQIEVRPVPGYQTAVREVLRMFGGMGSFQDLVLQTRQGVLPEQKELDGLRKSLFQEGNGSCTRD